MRSSGSQARGNGLELVEASFCDLAIFAVVAVGVISDSVATTTPSFFAPAAAAAAAAAATKRTG